MPIETSKDKIKQPDLASEDEGMIIAPIGSSVLISGKSGSGKSTLLVNLLNDKRFYKGFFKRIFWFSPTANGDDVQKSLGIPKKDVFTDLEEAPDILDVILTSQAEKIEEGSADTVDQYAVVFDDVIGDVQFMNCPEFTACFYRVRHANLTTFICTQHFNRVPRVCRLQANFIHYFQGSQSEVETLVDEFSPPCYSKKEFEQIIHDATSEKYSFITVNMKLGWDVRFRKNLDEFIHLERLYGGTCSNNTDTDQDGEDEQTDVGGGDEEPESRSITQRFNAQDSSESRRDRYRY